MEYDATIFIKDNKDKGTIKFIDDAVYLKVKEVIKEISFNQILAVKQNNNRVVTLLLTDKTLITIESKTDINLSMIFPKFKIKNNPDIRINNFLFKNTYTYSYPVTYLLIMLIIFIFVYDGLIGLSLADSVNMSPISAFISGAIFGFAEYPIDLVQIILFSGLLITIILEIVFQNKSIKDISDLLNNNLNLPKENLNDYSELEKLKELLDKNIITQEDYDLKKKDILNIK